MLDPTRLHDRMSEKRVSQSELARRVGVSQQAISRLLSGEVRGSKHVTKIARELATTPSYLEGIVDDPDENAPPPALEPRAQHILMPVALPSERALARMFAGLLETVDLSAPVEELALELAQLLPTGLSQLRGQLVETMAAEPVTRKAPAEALASDDRAPR